MTKRNAGRVVIRLDLRGQEELKRRLDELGPAGQRMGRDLEKAMIPVKREGRLGKAAMMELGDSIEDVARQAGPLGGVLTALGPAGLAMAAGLGAAALALREVFVLMERSREAAEFATQIETVSRVSGVAADEVLTFRTALRLAGGDAQAADASLKKFAERLGEFRNTGQGEGKDAFEFLGLTGEGFDRLPVEEALDRVLDRLADIEDPSRRVSLAEMLGLGDALPLLQQTGDEIERFREEADGINAAFSEEVLQRFADAGEAMRVTREGIERARQLQTLAVLPLEQRRLDAVLSFEQRKAQILTGRIPLRERETALLEEQRQLVQQLVDEQSRDVGANPYGLSGALVEANRLTDALEQINQELERRNRLVEANGALWVAPVAALFNGPEMEQITVGATARADAERELTVSLERRRELEALVEQQLTGLMTPLQRVEQLESDLIEARRIGLEISEDQIAAIVAEARERAGLNEALDEELRLREKIVVAATTRSAAERGKKPLIEDAPGTVGNPIVNKAGQGKAEAIAQAEAYRQAIEDDQAAFASTTARFVADGVRAGAERGWEGALDMMRRRLADMLYESIFESVRNGLMDALEGTDAGGGGGFWSTVLQAGAALFGGGGAAAGAAAGAAGGVGKATGAELGTALLGMDSGADILVGGRPGVDRNVVSINDQPAFRVSAGERMRVEPVLGGAGGGGGGTVERIIERIQPVYIMEGEMFEARVGEIAQGPAARAGVQSHRRAVSDAPVRASLEQRLRGAV